MVFLLFKYFLSGVLLYTNQLAIQLSYVIWSNPNIDWIKIGFSILLNISDDLIKIYFMFEPFIIGGIELMILSSILNRTLAKYIWTLYFWICIASTIFSLSACIYVIYSELLNYWYNILDDWLLLNFPYEMRNSYVPWAIQFRMNLFIELGFSPTHWFTTNDLRELDKIVPGFSNVYEANPVLSRAYKDIFIEFSDKITKLSTNEADLIFLHWKYNFILFPEEYDEVVNSFTALPWYPEFRKAFCLKLFELFTNLFKN